MPPKKPTRKGRPEERLVIQDPGAVLDRLFKTPPKKKAKRGKKKV